MQVRIDPRHQLLHGNSGANRVQSHAQPSSTAHVVKLCAHATEPAPVGAQAFSDICDVLKSLPRIKGVRISIKAEFWGEEYAVDSEKPSYTGTIDRWANAAKKEALYVLWEGYSRNQLSPLDKMDVDLSGNSLDLQLLPYEDGRAAPMLHTTAPCGAADC